MISFTIIFRGYFLAFKTPEECFLDEAATTKFEWGSINPQEFVSKLNKGSATQTYHKNVNIKHHIELVLFSHLHFLDARSCYFTRTTSIRFVRIKI